MPGYDIGRFVGVAEPELQELICRICLQIFNNPVCSPCCGQTYCSDCINECNTCPNDRQTLVESQLNKTPKFVLKLWNKLNIKCDFYSLGCTETIPMANLSSHSKKCIYNPENKCKNCGLIVDSKHNCILNLKLQNESISDENKRLKEESIDWQSNKQDNFVNCTDTSLKIIQSTMPPLMKQDALKLVKTVISKNKKCNSKLTNDIIKAFNAKYGMYWNCIHFEDGKGCSSVHPAPKRSIWLKSDQHSIIIFKSA